MAGLNEKMSTYEFDKFIKKLEKRVCCLETSTSGSPFVTYKRITTDYTASAGEALVLGGSLTVTLPPAADNANQVVIIRQEGVGATTVAVSSGDTIIGISDGMYLSDGINTWIKILT